MLSAAYTESGRGGAIADPCTETCLFGRAAVPLALRLQCGEPEWLTQGRALLLDY